jgi:trehalose 6-phosphate phosphatase
VEVKKASLVLHTRAVSPADEREVVDRAVAALEQLGHDRFHFGKHVLDVGFSDTSKGAAVAAIRSRLGCDVVVFAGDDTTDETVFEQLWPGDIGVKVGDGDTAAGHRVQGPEDVVGLLEALVDR